jgi:hypothetical protein
MTTHLILIPSPVHGSPSQWMYTVQATLLSGSVRSVANGQLRQEELRGMPTQSSLDGKQKNEESSAGRQMDTGG